jgi:hypothetical protein
MTFDSGASRAAKEAASKRDFTDYKQAQAAKSSSTSDDSSSPRSRTFDPSGNAPPVIPRSTPPTLNGQTTGNGGGGNGYSGSYHQYNYYPDPRTYSTRSVRIHNYYGSYYSRPYIYYNDNYSSLFWWWLLDRPLEERAMWTYYHRNDMDPARYQALVYNDLALDERVRELEQRLRSPRHGPRPHVFRPIHQSRVSQPAHAQWPDRFLVHPYSHRHRRGRFLRLADFLQTLSNLNGLTLSPNNSNHEPASP